jgi:hypothetical protein
VEVEPDVGTGVLGVDRRVVGEAPCQPHPSTVVDVVAGWDVAEGLVGQARPVVDDSTMRVFPSVQEDTSANAATRSALVTSS